MPFSHLQDDSCSQTEDETLGPPLTIPPLTHILNQDTVPSGRVILLLEPEGASLTDHITHFEHRLIGTDHEDPDAASKLGPLMGPPEATQRGDSFEQ